MKTDPEILKLKAKLEEVKAPENWSEITGPFFHLKLPGVSSSGPYLSAGLKAMAEEECFPEETVIRDAKNIGDWINIYAHPAFQRRKPQIVGEEETIPTDKTAFILVDGQKHGPLAPEEIKTLLKQQEILLTDQVSFDDGHTWRKLYEYQDFDRRALEQNELPDIPGWEIFKSSNEEISDQLEHPDEEEVELNAFAGLAFIENVQTGRSHDQKEKVMQTHHETLVGKESSPQQEEEEERGADIVEFKRRTAEVQEAPTPSGLKTWQKNAAYVGAICLMLGASGYMLFNDPMQGVNLLTGRGKAAKKLIKRGTATRGRTPKAQEEMIKRAEEQERKYTNSRINKIRTPPSRMPASITDTETFQEAREMQERPFRDNEDPYQEYPYDDGSTPVTQDSVRKRLDKQTIDSEGQYYNEAQQNQFAGTDDSTVEGVWGNGVATGKRAPAQEDSEGEYQDEAQYQDEGEYDGAPAGPGQAQDAFQEGFTNEAPYDDASSADDY